MGFNGFAHTGSSSSCNWPGLKRDVMTLLGDALGQRLGWKCERGREAVVAGVVGSSSSRIAVSLPASGL